MTSCLTMLCLFAVGTASSQPPENVHYHEPFDYEQWRRDHPLPAAKRAADLDVGEPRTVRTVYFLPNDRPHRAAVVQDMMDRIREVHTFYSVSMQAHDIGDRMLHFETDDEGEPFVHRADGKHSDSHYIEDTFSKVLDEIRQTFDLEQNIYLVVIDISTDVIDRSAGGIAFRNGKTGGFALVTSNEMDPFNYHNVVSHELGHTFGLQHDFRDRRYVMSYGNWPESQLSACNAGFLSVNPYLNPDVSIVEGPSPTIERTSPLTYTAASTTTLSFSPDGRQLVSKSFDGFIELWDAATLENTGRIPIGHLSIDIAGGFVRFSPDGTLLATGTDYNDSGYIVGSVKLWDAVTKENVATFEEHDSQIKSGAFSPDGSLLASGSFYGVIKLWDIVNRKSVATLEGHAGSVSSLSFSPDGTVLASGSKDGTVLLWDVQRVQLRPQTITWITDDEQEGPAGAALPRL